MYYRFKKATEIRKNYLSWIGKTGHVGQGNTAILKKILIKAHRPQDDRRETKAYRVIFEFNNRKCFSAEQFLKNNNLK